MDPLVFISMSRFRHHLGLREDYGYNKTLKQWVQTTERSPDYYDIPVDFINSYGLNPNGKNRRPRDRNRGEKWNVFLEADGHPSGDRDPNSNVPTFLYERNDGNIRLHQYWLFFGYNTYRFKNASLRSNKSAIALEIIIGKFMTIPLINSMNLVQNKMSESG